MALQTHAAAEPPTIRLRVESRELNRIDPRLFGQFLERPSWGETGPEAAVDEDGNLPAEMVALLKDMRIPIVRFPGGTDVDFIDWTDMISNVPGRAGEGRPVTLGHKGDKVANRFGYDEYLRLADKALYLHVINRSWDRELSAEIDLRELGVGDAEAARNTLVPSPREKLADTRAWMVRQDATARFAGGVGAVAFPKASVSVVKIGL